MPSQGIMDPPSPRRFNGTLGSGFEARGLQKQPQGFTSLAALPTSKLQPRSHITMTPLSVANPTKDTRAGARRNLFGVAQSPSIPPPRTLGAPIFPGPDAFEKSKPLQSIYLLPRTERSPMPFLPDALHSPDEEHLFPRPLGPPRLDPRSTLPWEVHNLAPIF